MQEEVMDWQSFKQGKGQSVQEYTQEFRKRAMILGVSLYTQDTLLKYIGGLQEYLKYTILIFNPTNIDEVSVQAIHLETGRKNNNYSVESRQLKEGKDKGKEKMNWSAIVKKEDAKLSCSHCQRDGHDAEHCWKLHPELKPKWFKDQKGKQKATIIVEDLGSDSEDETKITIVRVIGKVIVGNDSNIGSVVA